MGYSTDFKGEFKTDRPVDEETARLLKGLATTRRMAKDVDEKYGIEGEFHFEEFTYSWGSDKPKEIIDYNRPPKTQPSLWCQWLLKEDNQTIAWDGGEKFYEYKEWLDYIIESVLKPAGYNLNGKVKWFGEDRNDEGEIVVKDNSIYSTRY